jgi:PEGA domain-containing protein
MANEGPRARNLRSLSAVLLAFLAMAQPSVADAADVQAAREHFDRGYALAQSGAFESAIEEFTLAYAASPNFSVLFNLGQAYGASGRAVQAASTLRRYLEIGGSNIDAPQRRRANELIAYYQRRIGRIQLSGLPSGARVSLDGEELGIAPFAAPLEASAGNHALLVQAPGYAAANQAVVVVAGQTSVPQLVLRPEGESRLILSCELPDVAVAIDGQRVAQTPALVPLEVAPGEHLVTLSRAGYATFERKLTWRGDETKRLDCNLQSSTAPSNLARLVVRHPAGTSVQVDGRAVSADGIPAGSHQIRVAGAGFETASQRVQLRPGQRFSVFISPRREASALTREREQRIRNQKLAAYLVGAGAVLTGGATAVLAVLNASRYDDWRSKSNAFSKQFQRAPASTTSSQLDQLLTEENAIRNRDAAAIGLGVAGVTLAVTSAALYFTAGKSAPTLTVTPLGAASVGYSGAF